MFSNSSNSQLENSEFRKTINLNTHPVFALKEDNLLLNQFLSVPDTDMESFKKLSGKLESRLALESGGEKLELKSSVFESVSDSESLSDAIGEIRLNMGDSSLCNFEENKSVSRKWAWAVDDSEMPELEIVDFKEFLGQIQEKEESFAVLDVYNSISKSEFWPSMEKRKRKKLKRKSKIKNSLIDLEENGLTRKDSQETLSEEILLISEKTGLEEFQEMDAGVDLVGTHLQESVENLLESNEKELMKKDSHSFSDENLMHSTEMVFKVDIIKTRIEAVENELLQTASNSSQINLFECNKKDSLQTLSEEKEIVPALSHDNYSKELIGDDVSLSDNVQNCTSTVEKKEMKQVHGGDVLDIEENLSENCVKEGLFKDNDQQKAENVGKNTEQPQLDSYMHQPELESHQINSSKNDFENVTRKKSTNVRRKKNKEKLKNLRQSPKITSKIIKQGASPTLPSNTLVDHNSDFNFSNAILPKSTLSDMIRTAPVINESAMPDYDWNLSHDSPPPQCFYDQEYYCCPELFADVGVQVTPKSDLFVDTEVLHDFDSQETFSDIQTQDATEFTITPNLMKEKALWGDFSTSALHPMEYQNHGLIHSPPPGYTYVRTLGYIPMSEIPYPIYILVPLTELYPDLQNQLGSDVYDVIAAERFLIDRWESSQKRFALIREQDLSLLIPNANVWISFSSYSN